MSIIDRETLMGLLQPRRLSLGPGDLLLREGEVSSCMYLVEEGQLEVLREDEDGQALTIGQVLPGELVGEVSLLQGTPQGTTVRATTECRLLEISRGLLERFDPERSTPLEYLLREMTRSVGERLQRTSHAAVETLRRELELLRLRQAMASFLVVLLLGLAAYAVLMKVLSEQRLDLRSTAIITAPLLAVMAALGVAWTRRSGLPPQIFGLTGQGAGRHARQAVVWTLPVLGLLVAIKWGLVTWSPSRADEPVFSGLLALRRTLWPTLVYVALVPVQEFIARGAIQGSLYEFLPGSERRRHALAIVVSNALFAVTHLHLTLAYGGAAFMGGLLWGALFARQRSLVGPVVSHALVGVFALEFLGFGSILKGVG